MQHRRIPPRRHIPAFKSPFILRRIIRPIPASQIPIMTSMRMHGMKVPASCWSRVRQPHYVQCFADESREGVVVVVWVPAVVGERSGVVRCLSGSVDLHKIRHTVVSLGRFSLVDQIVLGPLEDAVEGAVVETVADDLAHGYVDRAGDVCEGWELGGGGGGEGGEGVFGPGCYVCWKGYGRFGGKAGGQKSWR